MTQTLKINCGRELPPMAVGQSHLHPLTQRLHEHARSHI